jgi:hypothetical protein
MALEVSRRKAAAMLIVFRVRLSNEEIRQSTALSVLLKVHKIENFFDSDFGICIISL